jgi:hypothetical protein
MIQSLSRTFPNRYSVIVHSISRIKVIERRNVINTSSRYAERREK